MLLDGQLEHTWCAGIGVSDSSSCHQYLHNEMTQTYVLLNKIFLGHTFIQGVPAQGCQVNVVSIVIATLWRLATAHNIMMYTRCQHTWLVNCGCCLASRCVLLAPVDAPLLTSSRFPGARRGATR